MRNIFVFCCIVGFLFGCALENPAPDTFVEYQYPVLENVNSESLYALNDEILSGSFGKMHSLIIIKNDKIIFENYYNGYKREDLQVIGTATRSIVSTLLGILLYEQNEITIDTTIIHFFPQYADLFDNIPQKDKISIQHLLTNTAGFWWDEISNPVTSPDNDAYVMSQSNDWIANVLKTPMIREPGFEFNLNSGLPVLMAPILQTLSGQDLETFAKEKLFDPLEINHWQWDTIPGGLVNSAWGLHLRTLDLAKIGYLYLKRGQWQDRIIFDEAWFRRSTRYRVDVNGYYGFGYLWWRFTNNADVVRTLKQNDVFFAMGDTGQFLVMVPHLDMVVALTADNPENSATIAITMLKDYIFPSVYNRFQ